jgi:hypothetical protein
LDKRIFVKNLFYVFLIIFYFVCFYLIDTHSLAQ